jgi:threonine synthase
MEKRTILTMTVATQIPTAFTTQAPTSFCTKLVSKEGGTEYPLKAIHICEETFAPLEVAYDYDLIRRYVTRETIQAGPHSIWRYRAV